jgi:hypothetical protein
MKTLAMLMFTLAGIASAQTSTYDLTGQGCNAGSPTACTFHFSDGRYWATGQYTQYVFTPVGAIEPSAYSCTNPASGNWTQTVPNPVPFNAPVTFTFGCMATLINTNQAVQMSAAFQAHSFQVSFVCGGKGGTRICHATRWVLDSGFLMIGPPPPPSSNFVGGICP